MFKPFKLIDKTNNLNASTSTSGLRVNSTLGPTQKQYKSLIFNSASSQYLSRTPISAGNRKTFTWSGWVKRSTLGVLQTIFSGGTTDGVTTSLQVTFNASDSLAVAASTVTTWRATSAVYRDTSAWYHIVVAVDTTQSSDSNRIKIYVNGILIESFGINNSITQNADTGINSTEAHAIGRRAYLSDRHFDGYISEINFIDGYAYGPEFFGYFDSLGIWQPKRFSGAYGRNGFYLPFNDSSFTDLVKDKSGNNNNWTLNGYSSSLINDVVVSDSPVNNYCTLNSLNSGSFTTLSLGNLNAYGNTSTNNGNSRSTIGFSTGKWYFEMLVTGVGGSGTYPRLGIILPVDGTTPDNGGTKQVGYTTNSIAYEADGTKRIQNSSSSYGSSFTTNDTIGVAIDADNGAIYFSKNGFWQNSGVPTSGSSRTGAAYTWTGGQIEYLIGTAQYNGSNGIFNFGQKSFRYSPPTGFKTLCSANLPVPSITNGRTGMDAISYFGNNSIPATDPYASYIKLAMPLNANETYYDISPVLSNNLSRVKQSTNSGTTFPTTSPANTKFYTGSSYFDSGGTDRITITNSDDFKFGTGDFTVEVWARFESFPGITRNIVKCSDNNSWASGWSCVFGSAYSNRIAFYDGLGSYYYASSTLSTGTWYHLAWTRQNGTVRIFINGALDATHTIATSLSPTADLSIGNDISSNWPINGWLQDLRVYKGLAKYTSNFTPPTQMITTERSSDTKVVSGLNFSPDLVWIKAREKSGLYFTGNKIFDTVRGAYKALFSETTDSDQDYTSSDKSLTSFDSNGFTLKDILTAGWGVAESVNYIAWAWDAGSTNSTNTSGSITSTVRANVQAGFSIVSYTGTGANATVGHGLGVAPAMIIVKNRNPSVNQGEWTVYHKNANASPATGGVFLNLTNAFQASSTYWNNTAPTSSVFSIGTNGVVNENTKGLIAYCFAEIEGYSKFGSYTGNGSSDGPFVYCGFKPKWILIKRSTGSDGFSNWHIYDSVRNVFNISSNPLYTNSSGIEISGIGIDILSNGFKVRDNATAINASADYIFAAFAEYPFKYSRAR